MVTFAELTQRVSARLQDPDNTAVSFATVQQQINAAINYRKQRKFWFNTLNDPITLNIGDPILPGPTVLYLNKKAGMRILYQNFTYDLTQVSNEQYDGQNINQNGRPYAYTWRNGNYYLYFIPDQAYQVYLNGVKDYADLVNPTDTNDFTVYADEMIMYDALSRLIAELRTDPTMSDYYTKRADDEQSNLRQRTDTMVGTGRVQTDDSYNYY